MDNVMNLHQQHQHHQHQQQLPSHSHAHHTAYRSLQPQAGQAIQHPQSLQHPLPHLGHQHHSLDLNSIDENAVFHQNLRQLQDPNAHSFQANPYERAHNHGHQMQQQVQNDSPHTPHQSHQAHQHSSGGQYDMLTAPMQHNAIARLQQEDNVYPEPPQNTARHSGLGHSENGHNGLGHSENAHAQNGNLIVANGQSQEGSDQKSNGHLSTLIVENPPNLAEWRQRLFDVDEVITLSEEDYNTYFPHVDNVYSHRSTQKYKRKPFVSHYWDCRLKGRPPGTPKSDDPNKKKRKRTARERDLCDVKIKITEYFPNPLGHTEFAPDGAQPDSSQANNFFSQGQPAQIQQQAQQFIGMPMVQQSFPPGHPSANGARFYTIQRVNGNGGNGKSDGVAGPHKHTLEESDRVKKNTVQRHMAKKDKEEKRTQKTYHKKASGSALVTVRKHAKEAELKMFGSCSCPFSQRVWIALEFLNVPYQYIEVDPSKKPMALLEISPQGNLPGIRHNDWGCGESTVLLEYLDDVAREGGLPQSLLPLDSRSRATSRLWADHVNRNIIPLFYTTLQEQNYAQQLELVAKLQGEIEKIVQAANVQGPFFLGPQLSYVDIQFAPWMLRFTKVLKHYRPFPDPVPRTRWAQWMEAVESNEFVKNTISLDELYIDSYERYSQNRQSTSELADAVNGGWS